MATKAYRVSCHCGRVQAKFRREKNLPLTVWDCNCSDCSLRRNLHFMIPASDFWLVDTTSAACEETLDDESCTRDDAAPSSTKAAIQTFERETTLYQWGTKTAVRRFCSTCGVLPFYVPRSNPDGYGITYPCVNWGEDGPPPTEIKAFDGVNWEKSHQDTNITSETSKKTK